MDTQEKRNGNLRGPLVSIGMPVFNGAEFIRDAAGAILAQSYRNLELIICDNASTDSTRAVCQAIVQGDERVQYFANPTNIGVTANYNRAFQLSRGKYFKWASSNDYCAPDLISRCVEVLERRPDVALCYPRTRLFDEDIRHAEDYDDDLNLQGDDPVVRFEQLIDRIYAQLNNVMNGVIRSDALKGTQLHRAFAGSDHNFIAEVVLRGKFVEVPEPLFYRRINRQAHSRMQSPSDMQKRMWPDDKKAVLFQTWRLHQAYFADASRAPLSLCQKARIYLILARRLNWRKRELIGELASAIR